MYNIKDLKKYNFFFKKELKNKLIITLNKNRLINYTVLKNNKYSKTKLVNSCIISGRSRGVFRKLKVSRVFINQIDQAAFKNFKKIPW